MRGAAGGFRPSRGSAPLSVERTINARAAISAASDFGRQGQTLSRPGFPLYSSDWTTTHYGNMEAGTGLGFRADMDNNEQPEADATESCKRRFAEVVAELADPPTKLTSAMLNTHLHASGLKTNVGIAAAFNDGSIRQAEVLSPVEGEAACIGRTF
jgi:hypothetical protein